MSSLKFESLKDDFESVTTKIDRSGLSTGAIQRLNTILSSLESEAQAAPDRYRMGMVEDVDDYRQQLKGYKAQATGMGIVTNDGAKNMDRMAQSIQRSTATALESERIGTEVIEDLNWQRERISGARDRLQEAHTEIGHTRVLIRSIWANVASNRWLLIGIIVMELLLIPMIIYIKWFK